MSLTSGDSLSLVYGDTTLTPAAIDTLVVKANTLEAGEVYSFRLTVTNSIGAWSSATLNVTAGRSPWGGWVDVSPQNGSALTTKFTIRTGNWTDDPDSYPLRYLFEYSMSSGGTVPVEAEYKATPNTSTILPLGFEEDYGMPLIARVSDVHGGVTAINTTAYSMPPPLESAVELAANQTAEITSLLDAGDDTTLVAAATMLSAGASVLSFVMSSEGATDEMIADAVEARASYLTAITSSTTMPASALALEASAGSISAVVASNPSAMTNTQQLRVLTTVSGLANLSVALGADSLISAGNALSAMSSTIAGGVLASTNGSSVSNLIGSTAHTLSAALTANMVAGEEAVELISDELGVSALKISSSLLGQVPVTVSVATATKNAGGVQPSFGLPSDMLSGSGGDFTATAINYGTNPYANQGATVASDDDEDDGGDGAQRRERRERRRRRRRRRRLLGEDDGQESTEGSLESNSTVTGLSVAGVVVSDLSSAIVITMALPTSSDDTDDGASNETTTHVLNCTKNGTVLAREVTTEDLSRAENCGVPDLYEGNVVRGSYLNETFYCPEADTYVTMDCNGTVGVQTYTCPAMAKIASCEYWDTVNQTWSSEGCVYWKSDLTTGEAYCNCTHLTDFTAQHAETVDENTAVFIGVTESFSEVCRAIKRMYTRFNLKFEIGAKH